MDYLTFNKVNQTSKFRNGGFKGVIKWHAREEGSAIVSLASNIGLSCFLHVSPELHGSIFDFRFEDQMITLVVDYVIAEKGQITRMNFLLEYVNLH